MGRLSRMVALFLGAAACSSGPSPVALDEAEPFEFELLFPGEIGPDFMPEAPMLPALPDEPAPPVLPTQVPCPEGWLGAMDEDVGAPVCVPWADGVGPACPPGEALFPGEAGCAAIGAPCPVGNYAEGLPSSGVLYVAALAASGGAGTPDDPTTLGEAFSVATPGMVVALGKGTHVVPGPLPAGIALVGACVSETVVTGGGEGVLVVDDSGVTVRDLSVQGDATPGIVIRGEDTVLDGILVDGASVRGLAVEVGAVTARSLVVRDVVPNDTPDASGIQVTLGGRLTLTRAAVERVSGASLVLLEMARAQLEQVALRDAEQPGDLPAWGVVAQMDATLDARALVVERAVGGGLLISRGASATFDHLVVRETDPGPSGEFGTGLQAQFSDIEVRRGLISQNRRTGVAHYGAGGSLTLIDTVVRDTQWSLPSNSGRGIDLADDNLTRLERTAVVRNRAFGVRVSEGSTFEAEDLIIRGTREDSRRFYGRGLSCANGNLALERVLVDDNRDNSILLDTSDAVLRDVRLVGLRAPLEDAAGTESVPVGLLVQLESSVDVERVLVEDTEGGGVGIVVGPLLTGTDLIIRDILPQASGEARGIELSDARASVERVVIEGTPEAGVVADLGSTIVLRDLRIDDTRINPVLRDRGHGLTVRSGSSLTAERVQLSGGHEVALFADRESAAEVTDLIVTDTDSSERFGRYGRAFAAQGGSVLQVTRALLDDNRDVAVSAMQGSTVTVEHLTVRDTRVQGCHPGCPQGGGGIGLGSYGSSLSVRNFRVETSSLAGAQAAREGRLVLERGVFARNLIGINLQSSLVRVEDLTNEVSFIDNRRSLDGSVLPVPEPIISR